jgi:crotonobetaine/carnitine-CoA ligase
VRLVIGYGLTESTFGTIQDVSQDVSEPASARNLDGMGRARGHPHPSIRAETRVVEGELWLRNPATFSGYFRDEASTAEVLLPDGWLRTGDLVRQEPDGTFAFVGRAKLVIRRRGENLSPAEVEAALERHPAVAEAAVIGVPAALGEDEVRAYVVLRPGATAGEEELAAHCATQLAPFKVPSQWRFLDRLPRTPTQRIAYHLLPR